MPTASQDDINNLMPGQDTTEPEQKESNGTGRSSDTTKTGEGMDNPSIGVAKETGESAVETTEEEKSPVENGIGSEEMQGANGDRGLDFILDIPLQISVELGRTQMLVNDLLRLGQGSIVELAKASDEPMDIYVNGKLFARGEVVIISEKFGIRLTDIISPIERVKKLG